MDILNIRIFVPDLTCRWQFFRTITRYLKDQIFVGTSEEIALTFGKHGINGKLDDCVKKPLIVSDQGLAIDMEKFREKLAIKKDLTNNHRSWVTDDNGVVTSAPLAAQLQSLFMDTKDMIELAFNNLH